jgi:hypothetical protein
MAASATSEASGLRCMMISNGAVLAMCHLHRRS